jgi:hypothetical protein
MPRHAESKRKSSRVFSGIFIGLFWVLWHGFKKLHVSGKHEKIRQVLDHTSLLKVLLPSGGFS